MPHIFILKDLLKGLILRGFRGLTVSISSEQIKQKAYQNFYKFLAFLTKCVTSKVNERVKKNLYIHFYSKARITINKNQLIITN